MTHLRQVGHPPTTAARTLPDQPRQDGAPQRPERPRPGTRIALGPAGQALAPRPFLKWAGGKRQLLPDLRLFYPRQFGRYFEPFVGSGAVFFDLAAHGLLDHGGARLSDVNSDVVGCYQALTDALPEVIRHLRRLASAYSARGEAHYYEVRDGQFNPARRKRRPLSPGGADQRLGYSPRLAAMLIYLNRTGFNGLFRLNARGEFNVPVGRYANPRICDEPTLHAAADALAVTRAEVRHESFQRVVDLAHRGDFIYLDPPYAPLTATSRFTSYTESGFTSDDQRALQRVVIALAERGCHVLLSNSTAPLVRELYEHDRAARDAGLHAWRVRARRAINARGSARGPIDEFLITNVPRRRGRTSLSD